MEISVAELLKGKSTIIKNREYFQTKTYVDPFLDKMSKLTNDFRIQVKTPEQMTYSATETDLTYNRVWIQAVLPQEYTIDSHEEVIGFLYGIDVKKPVVKIYRGYLNQACTNLTVFNPMWMNVQEMIAGDPINYNPVKTLMEDTSDFKVRLDKMKNQYLDRSKMTDYLGKWVDYVIRESQDYGYGKVKIAASTPIDAYKKLVLDADSEYYVPDNLDPNLFDVYNSFTKIVTDDKKDIMGKFEKTLLIGKMLGVVEQ